MVSSSGVQLTPVGLNTVGVDAKEVPESVASWGAERALLGGVSGFGFFDQNKACVQKYFLVECPSCVQSLKPCPLGLQVPCPGQGKQVPLG